MKRPRPLSLLGLLGLLPGTLAALLLSLAAPAAAVAPKPDAAAAERAFAADLYGRFAAGGKGNVAISPISVALALRMVQEGARGETEKQIATALHGVDREVLLQALAPPEGPAKVELQVANRLWAQKGYPFEAGFRGIAEKAYGAAPAEVDFKKAFEAARTQINAWVKERTRDHIPELIPAGALDESTRLVIANAVYFKGSWAQQFLPRDTRDQVFTLEDGGKRQVPTMHRKAELRYGDTGDAQILSLPYQGDALDMTIVLPHAADGLPALEKSLSGDSLGRWLDGMATREVDVYLPRFKLASGGNLVPVLKAMGMTRAFEPYRADFTGIAAPRKTKEDPLYLSFVFHRATIEVNEEGTVATAATGAGVARATAVVIPLTFRADHPFLYLIRDHRTGAILFLGRVVDPT
jgi:serine protease inhibitor